MTAAWPFGSLRMFGYGCVLADPPWYFKNYSAAGEAKNPVAHYGCMELDAIKALPVGQLLDKDGLLVVWATAPMLPQALDCIAAWGCRYVTVGVWAKHARVGEGLAFGTGYWLRSAAELFLLATNGRPRIKSHSERNLIAARLREHSRKPGEIHGLCERLVDGPYAELFAREPWRGWESWGNEVGKFGGAPAAEVDFTTKAPRHEGIEPSSDLVSSCLGGELR